MVDFPNGKINIGLSVTGKRKDGYHDIETIMYPVKLHDILEIIATPGKDFKFSSSGINIPGSISDNLVCKTFDLMKKKYDLSSVNIHLHKIIPPGSGLGGGSSDAAFTIKILNKLFSLGLTFGEMVDQAKLLGSDCAFFIDNKPLMVFGKGDEFEPIEIEIEKYFLVIIIPEIHISTADAYSWVKPSKKETPLNVLINAPPEQWKKIIVNEFEAQVISRYPLIDDILKKLYRLGSIFASLTGSGAAVYGIFDRDVEISAEFHNCFIWTNRQNPY
jgi:4-diphosphocytidyl-2-C-methyl-D-erythritol kinase